MSVNSTVVKRFLVGMAVLAVGLILGVFVITSAPAEIESGVVVADNRSGVERGVDANAARYTALAEYYATQGKAGLQRGIDAAAARYTALAATYTAQIDGLQRGVDAGAARYSALAAHYAAGENDRLRRGIDASAACYTALAEYYAAAGK